MFKAVKITNLLAFGLLLLIPFVNFLKFNDYDYFKPESLVIGLGLIVMGALCGMLYFQRHPSTKILIFALTITFALSFFPGWQSFFALILTFFLALLMAMLLQEHLMQILLVFSLIMLMAILFFPANEQFSQSSVWQKKSLLPPKKLPPILYVILDEHAGIDAFTNPGMKKNVNDFYQKQGFSVFSSAYSHYPSTYNSIPNLLNFTAVDRDDYYFSDPNHRVLVNNQFFELLSKKGYQIRVYQPDFIDYSLAQHSNINFCYTYPSLSIRLVENISLPLKTKFLFLLKSYLLQSSEYQIVMNFYQDSLSVWAKKNGINLPEWEWYQARVSSIAMLDAFAKLKSDIPKYPEGTVFFAHILAPHNPYLFDADCRVVPDISAWQITHGPDPLVNTILTRNQHYAAYDQQIRCVEKQMQGLFDTMKKAGVYNQAIIIVHGDHGSRIALHRPFEYVANQLTQQDLRDYYVTLFVDKIPGKNAVVNNQLLDLQTLLASAISQAIGNNLFVPVTKPYVYLYPYAVGDKLMKKEICSRLN